MRFNLSIELQRLAAESLKTIADGHWHNMCPEDVSDLGTTTQYLKRVLGLGIARAYGWVEWRDDTWARITSDGKVAVEALTTKSAA